jgi:putative ABC transport system permease protein
MSLVVHTEGDPSALRNTVLTTVRRINPNIPVYRVKTITEQIESALSPDRLMALLLAIFGGVALLLASVGVYGVVSYAVSQRTREIGIRMALGATKTNVLRLVLREGMVMTAAGVIVGLAAALALTRLISSLLFGLTATDVTTFSLITAALLLIALIACYIPARRATKVDPLVALRYE